MMRVLLDTNIILDIGTTNVSDYPSSTLTVLSLEAFLKRLQPKA